MNFEAKTLGVILLFAIGGLSWANDRPQLDVFNSGTVNGMEVTISVVRNPKSQLHELKLKILNKNHQEICGLQYVDNIPCECVVKMKDQYGLNCALTKIGEVRFGSKRSGFRHACTGFTILKGNEMIWAVPLKYYFNLYPGTWELEFDLAPFRFYSTVANDLGDGYPNSFIIKVASIVIGELDFEDLKR